VVVCGVDILCGILEKTMRFASHVHHRSILLCFMRAIRH
jgi:hypothetical protein